jgi:hypothetical protein
MIPSRCGARTRTVGGVSSPPASQVPVSSVAGVGVISSLLASRLLSGETPSGSVKVIWMSYDVASLRFGIEHSRGEAPVTAEHAVSQVAWPARLYSTRIEPSRLSSPVNAALTVTWLHDATSAVAAPTVVLSTPQNSVLS